ncbi:MAG: baseplate hub domain-containing protein [Ehrlichia sp.]
MKNISSQLKQHLSSEVLTIANCLQITLQNRNIIGLTDFDQSIVIDNITYESTPGLNIDMLKYNAVTGHSTKVEIAINSDIMKEEQIASGVYDFATVRIFLVNYTDLAQGIITLFCGSIEKNNFNQS